MFIYVLLLIIVCYVRDLNARFNKKIKALKEEHDWHVRELRREIVKSNDVISDKLSEALGEVRENVREVKDQMYDFESEIRGLDNRIFTLSASFDSTDLKTICSSEMVKNKDHVIKSQPEIVEKDLALEDTDYEDNAAFSSDELCEDYEDNYGLC